MTLVNPEEMKKNILQMISAEAEEEEKRPTKLELPSGNIFPIRKQKVIIEQMNAAAEAHYFWILNFMRGENALGYKVEKTSDVYTATEASSYFGAIEARKEAQMRNVNQYMATIGQLIKNLFQMIRELRIIDERLDYYKLSKKGDDSAEVALKGIWTSMVEGGGENPGSVMGLGRKLGFVIVPDLFFKINPKDGSKGVGREVEALKEEGINNRVRSILKQKLMQYYLWKERTGKELEWRKKFVLKSLAQTYHSVKLYTHWLKPYLRNIHKLQMSNINSPDLVTAFETNYIQLELFGVKDTYEVETPMGVVEKKFSRYFPCIKVNFTFTTRPEMAYQQEYAHRGALHAGRTVIEIEGYVLSKEQLDQYRIKKENEDLELLKSVEESVESLGEELYKYLKEAGELDGKVEKKSQKSSNENLTGGILEPFVSIFKGFSEIFGGLIPEIKSGKNKKMSEFEISQEKSAAKVVSVNTYTLYDVFKKSNGMLSW